MVAVRASYLLYQGIRKIYSLFNAAESEEIDYRTFVGDTAKL